MDKHLYNTFVLKSFMEELRSHKASKATIKNYLTDINQFLNWREKLTLLDKVEEDSVLVSMYIKGLTQKFSPASLKRKSSVVRKYLAFEYTHPPHFAKAGSKYNLIPALGGMVLLLLITPLFNANKQPSINEDATISPTTYTISSKPTYGLVNPRGVSIVLSATEEGNNNMPIAETINTDIQVSEPITTTGFSSKGVANINSGKTQAVIISDSISSDSVIYLTPKSATNQILFLKETGGGYAVIAVEEPTERDIEFQWKVDNTEVYHSML